MSEKKIAEAYGLPEAPKYERVEKPEEYSVSAMPEYDGPLYTEKVDKEYSDVAGDTSAKEEAMARQRKHALTWSAISDGLSALANLYGAANGAPSVFDPAKGMSAAALARWEKRKADWEKRKADYLNYHMKAEELDEQRRAAHAARWAKETELGLQAHTANVNANIAATNANNQATANEYGDAMTAANFVAGRKDSDNNNAIAIATLEHQKQGDYVSIPLGGVVREIRKVDYDHLVNSLYSLVSEVKRKGWKDKNPKKVQYDLYGNPTNINAEPTESEKLSMINEELAQGQNNKLKNAVGAYFGSKKINW